MLVFCSKALPGCHDVFGSGPVVCTALVYVFGQVALAMLVVGFHSQTHHLREVPFITSMALFFYSPVFAHAQENTE